MVAAAVLAEQRVIITWSHILYCTMLPLIKIQIYKFLKISKKC
jgi:hypothetical protein